MLPQRSRWLLPALIVSWVNLLQSSAALPAHDERGTHVSADTFDPSATTSTMIRQDYNRRAYPSDGKNDTQSSQKLVASPAGLLRPDKFQFYTYNDKGDMITRQMTVQEIQGLIAAGGADHVAMDKQEPQKADDVLTGGKKVMDVVQKVQNVLKSALDKPPILTGSIPKIPEHANVEWSNILPSILSGETDAISTSSESNQSSRKPTTDKTVAASSTVGHASLAEGTNTIISNDAMKKPVIQSDMQTNAYAGFTNNMEHLGKPQYGHHSQQTVAFSEKPMIPVPVITLMEQKLSTLQSSVTESPIFQMLSVIPVNAAENVHDKGDQTATSITTELSIRTESTPNRTEQFVELTLSQVPEQSTLSQVTSLDMHPVNITRQTSPTKDKVGQGITVSTVTYAMTAPSVSTDSSVIKKQNATYQATTHMTDQIPSSDASYVLIRNKNNTDSSGDLSFATDITKESQVNAAQNNNQAVSQTDITILPVSHVSSPKPEEASNETLHAPSTLVSRIETSTISTLRHTDRLQEASSMITQELSMDSVTSAYTTSHLHARPSGIESSVPMEPLPTQLIDAFSSVMSQISEVKPPVLSLPPDVPMANVDYSQKRNVSDDSAKTTIADADTRYDTSTLGDANNESFERIDGLQITKSPSQDVTIRTDYATTQRFNATTTDKESTMNWTISDVTASPATSTTVTTTNNKVTLSHLTTVPSAPNVQSTDSTISASTTTKTSMWVQLEKVHNVSLKNQSGTTVTPDVTTNVTSEKHATDGITDPIGELLPITPATTSKTTKTQSTSASKNTGGESSTEFVPIKEHFDSALASLNWSDPMSAIDQVLNIAPLPSSTPSIKPISLPNNTSKLAASDLASGLIAGFTTGTTEKTFFEGISENPILKNVSSSQAVRLTVLSEVTSMPAAFAENITKMHEEATRVNANDKEQKEKNVTRTQTQKPAVKDATENGTSELNAQTKEVSGTCSIASTDKKATGAKPNCESDATASDVLTKEPTELSNNSERIDDSIEQSSSSSASKLANTSSEPKNSIEQTTVAAGIIIANPERLSTINVNIKQNISKTPLDTNHQDNREKMKTTEAPVVKTDTELTRLPVKVASVNKNNTGNTSNSMHAENNLKTEVSNKKNDSVANTVSATEKISIQGQPQDLSGHKVDSVNNSDSGSHNSQKLQNNAIANINPLNTTLNTTILLDKNSSHSAFLQTTHRLNNATSDKIKNANATTPMMQHAVVTSRPSAQKDNVSSPVSSSSSSSSIQKENTNIDIKFAEQMSSNTSEKYEDSSQPNSINYSNPANSTSNQSNKNTVQVTSTSNASLSELSVKNTSMQGSAQLNNTEGKSASSKHSENPSKPEVTRLQLSTLRPLNALIRPTPKPTVGHKSSEKSDISKTETDANIEDKWTLISQQTPPVMSKLPKPAKPSRKPIDHTQTPTTSNLDENNNVRSPASETSHQHQDDPPQVQSVLPLDASQSISGLDATVKHTSGDIINFAKLCNELAFNFWVATNKGLSTARSLALSPFGMTSLLAMIFLGARGPTSDQMNEVLGLDDVATFNPHLVFQNITDTVSLARGQGIANAAFVRELFADKMKVRKLMPFYKEQAQQFYEGLVAEVNFATISDLVRRRTNLLVRKQTGGRIKDFVKTNTVPLRSPLAALSANVFQTDCNTSLTSSIGRDGELYFAVSPAVRQRRLVPVPATTWRSGVLAGYEPSIDATAVALGGSDRLVSTIFVLPGQQGHTAPGDTLDRLEQRLIRTAFRDGTWNKLLKVLIPRSGLELQLPKFSHRSVVNATAALKRMGLDELFSGNADFKGINGVGHRLHLADVLQMNLFSTCGDENILSGRHHVETYPASPLRSIRQRLDDSDDLGNVTENGMPRASQEDRADSSYADQSHREKRQLSATSERPRLKLDRPFLYFVRHNPSGIILHMGRFNPRLLP